MSDINRRFWPYQPKTSIISTALILIGLLLVCGILKKIIDWPSDGATNIVLIGIFILSLLPIVLSILDVIRDSGGSIGYKDFKIEFSKLNRPTSIEVTVPANIGAKGTPVYESNTHDILNALKEAGTSNIVVVDIEDGNAWWKTRLFVLLSGAVKLGTPEKIVFIGKISGQHQSFIGWANSSKLFGIILHTDLEYKQAFYNSKAAAKQWELIEIVGPNKFGTPPFAFGNIAANKQYMFFDPQTGLPNEFLQEQFLQNELGSKIETVELKRQSLNITVGKLIDLFGEVLVKDSIDQNWAKEEQIRAFFKNDSPNLVLTENGKYLRMVSRLSVINEMLKAQVLNKENKQS